MKRAFILAMVIFPWLGQAQTLAELVAKEEGVEFGVCDLAPKPTMAGEKIVAVLPARFPDPAFWQTYEMLLVGVTGEKVVETKTLKLKDGINPRLAQVDCKGNRITLREISNGSKAKVRRYQWDGSALTAIK